MIEVAMPPLPALYTAFILPRCETLCFRCDMPEQSSAIRTEKAERPSPASVVSMSNIQWGKCQRQETGAIVRGGMNTSRFCRSFDCCTARKCAGPIPWRGLTPFPRPSVGAQSAPLRTYISGRQQSAAQKTMASTSVADHTSTFNRIDRYD